MPKIECVNEDGKYQILSFSGDYFIDVALMHEYDTVTENGKQKVVNERDEISIDIETSDMVSANFLRVTLDSTKVSKEKLIEVYNFIICMLVNEMDMEEEIVNMNELACDVITDMTDEDKLDEETAGYLRENVARISD